VGFFTLSGVLAWCWLCAYLLYWLVTGERPTLIQRRRRGGYIKPRVSHTPSRGITLTSGLIRRIEDCSSLSGAPGLVSEAWETPRMLRDPSRLTGRGWSIGVMDAGANGRPVHSAD
jgi:hypothetical protein